MPSELLSDCVAAALWARLLRTGTLPRICKRRRVLLLQCFDAARHCIATSGQVFHTRITPQVVDFLTERLPPSAVGGAPISSAQRRPAFPTWWSAAPGLSRKGTSSPRSPANTSKPKPSLCSGARAGIIVLNAHRVQDSSGESFAVRLLRAGGNRTAFVRALSDRPGELVRGFGSVDRVLKASFSRLPSHPPVPLSSPQ